MANTSDSAAGVCATIHVNVMKAENLPLMFGKQQNPYIVIRSPVGSKNFTRTDAVHQAGLNPEWGDHCNHHLEVHYEGTNAKNVKMSVEAWNEERGSGAGDELIGTGVVNISSIVQKKLTEPQIVTVPLKDSANGSELRGEVALAISCGPPVRKSVRALQRAGKILEVRDSFVGSVLATKNVLTKAVEAPAQLVTAHRKKAIAASVGAAGGLAAVLAMVAACAVPIALVLLFTFPLWIIPALLTSFATAPIWVPILACVFLAGCAIGLFLLALGATSHPIRKKTSLYTTKMKQSDLGKRVLYEKEF